MKSPKKALILGITGQDGAHLAAHLVSQGWEVYGGFRRGSSSKTWRLDHLNITNEINLVNINIDEPYNIIDVFKTIMPNQIYHFAGESFVADSYIHPHTTLNTNTLGTLNVLDAMRLTVPEARLFFASSSEVFEGGNQEALLDEQSVMLPTNPYGISKMTAQHLVRMYRQNYGLFACTGILFNHEGPLRARNFVTRKITFNLARLKIQGGDPIELGHLGSARDWGAAEDYTQAMTMMLGLDEPEDFVFATGNLTTVRGFLEESARAAGFDPIFEGDGVNEKCLDLSTGMELAHVSSRYYRPYDTGARMGDSKRLIEKTGWGGSRPVKQIAAEMVKTDIERWKKGITNV